MERRRGGQGGGAVVGKAAVLPQRIGLVAGHRQQRVAARLVMIVEVFVAQGQRLPPLGPELLQPVVHKTRVALIVEAPGQLTAEAEAVVNLAQEQHPAGCLSADRSVERVPPDKSATIWRGPRF